MRRIAQFSLAMAAATAAYLAVLVQGHGIDYAKIEILTEKIAPNLYMLAGSGGADPGIRTRRAAGSACSPGRRAS